MKSRLIGRKTRPESTTVINVMNYLTLKVSINLKLDYFKFKL